MRVCLISLCVPAACCQTNTRGRQEFLHIRKARWHLEEIYGAANVDVASGLSQYIPSLATYDLLAISCFTSYSYPYALSIAHEARHRGQLVMLGGNHATYLSPVPELFNYVHRGRAPYRRQAIAVCYQEDGTIDVCLSEGCPFQCSFCSCVERHAHPLATPSLAATQLAAVAREYPTATINVEDTCFFAQGAWYRAFLRAFDAPLDNVFHAQTRPELLTEEDLSLLYGVFPNLVLHFGLERLNPAELLALNKCKAPERYLARFRAVRHWLAARNKHWSVNLLVGYPGDNAEGVAQLYYECDSQELSRAVGAILLYEHFPGAPFSSDEDYYAHNFGCIFPSSDWSVTPITQRFLVQCSSGTRASDVIALSEDYIRRAGITPDINWRSSQP